jgi:hypothetical protein
MSLACAAPIAAAILARQRDQDLALERSLAAEARRQRLALEKLHDQIGAAVRVHAGVVDEHQPRVMDRGHDARLGEDALHHVLLHRQLGQEELHRRAPLEHLVAREVHDSHAPSPSTFSTT